MGGSSSKSKSNTNTNSSPSVDVLLTRESETKTDISDESQRALEKKLKQIEDSLQHDKSHANIFAQFANVVEIEGLNKMDLVTEIVNSMGNGWRDIMKDEKKLTQLIGHTQMTKLKDIRCEYFRLLLKTKIVISGLLEQSEMQKENVMGLLRVVKKALGNGEAVLSVSDRLVYDERMQLLLQWIDQTKLVEIAEDWDALCGKLQAQKSTIEKLVGSFVDKVRNLSVADTVLWGLATAIMCGTFICAALCTGGVVAVVAAGGLIITAVTLTVGPASAIYLQKSDKMVERIKNITSMLQKYIKTCEVMREKVNDGMQLNQERMEQRKTKLNATTCEVMLEGLVKVDDYLDAYVEQGNKLVLTIRGTCAEFINH